MKLSQTIHVDVTPGRFVFRKGEKELQLEACIHYLLEKNEVTPIAFGDRVELDNCNFTELFVTTNPYTDHFYLLRLFLEYGLEKMTGGKPLPAFRPLVIYHGVEQLHTILGGYQFGIFETATLQAGARKVEFAS